MEIAERNFKTVIINMLMQLNRNMDIIRKIIKSEMETPELTNTSEVLNNEKFIG